MASTYIQRVDSANGNRKVWTWSAWVKRDVLGSVDQNMFSMGEAASEEAQFKFSSDQLSFFNDYASSGRVSASQPSRKFRDVNGWYHFVWRHKSDESTASDRWKIYINGERLDPSDYGNPSIPNEDGCYNKWENKDMWFGARAKAQNDNSYQYFSGLMSHIHFCDGYAYDASDFGSTDATTGEWKINTNPNVQYGSKGFFILKDGNSVTAQSPNTNNFTVAGGTLTKTEDCPSNVFATLNPLVYNTSNKVYGFGNTAITSSPNNSGEWQSTQTTLGASTGKYYCEIKINAIGNYHTLGVGYQPNISNVTSTQNIGELSGSAGWRNNGQTGIGNSFDTGGNPSLNTYTTGDILGIAMDLTNSKLYFSKNGTWENSGVPTSGSTGTGSIRNLTSGEAYHFVIAPRGGSTYCNFGNGKFGTTAVATNSGNGYAGAEGASIFNYQPPTGYSALSTKGLNT